MRYAAITVLLLFASSAFAHPSHVSGFMHPFVGVDHLLAMLAVGLWAAQLGGRWRWGLPLAFVGAMTLGGLAGFAGFALPGVEPMLAASVLVLGLVVALRVQWRAGGAALVAAFAVFHGIAHAAELPAGAGPAGYAAGFIAATALLHAAGVALGLAPRARAFGIPIALAGAWLLAGAVG
jgi:urease accessory protein